MDRILREQIIAAISNTRKDMEALGSYGFLPDIVNCLEAMLDGSAMSPSQRSRLAGGMGRLITESWGFSESPLGTTLLELADRFAEDDVA